MKIGVFDSGLGGLMILDAVRERLPMYDYIYYGDTKNLPYGDKTEEEIYELTRRAVIELFEHDVLLVIIACNTASAESLRRLQDTLLIDGYRERRILGVIIPTIEILIEDGHENVLLIGTSRTVESGKYVRELEKRTANHIRLTSIATPELVPLIESGTIPGAIEALEMYLTPRMGEIDTLVLGCTHYTVLKEHARKTYPGLRVISQDELIPAKLATYLERHTEIESRISRSGSCENIVTGEA